MTCEEFLRMPEGAGLWVFGTGFVAEMFWYALERHGLTDRVRGFLVSACPDGARFHDRPVRAVSGAEIPPETTVCLAVHESAAGEVLPLLEGRTKRIFPVYPYLTELCYGTPSRTAVVPLRGLLERQDSSYCWLTVRYAAAKARLGRSERPSMAEDLYLRAMAMHTGRVTAARRLGAFAKLIDDMGAEGWREDRPAFVLEDGRIIDGLHRTACAACLGIRNVPVKVFPDPAAYDLLLGEKNRLPERILAEYGFSAEETEFLRREKRELLGGG